jgi:hypothetical protein
VKHLSIAALDVGPSVWVVAVALMTLMKKISPLGDHSEMMG